MLSSDHAPFNYEDPQGKKLGGREVAFPYIPNGIPGLETRLPLLYSEGVQRGRLTVNEFVALTATNAAKLYGLYPRKGSIAVGSDADFVIWNDTLKLRIENRMLHHAVDYTPYEGFEVTAWPEMTFSRGELIWARPELTAAPGRGRFLRCARPDPARPRRPFVS